MIIHITMAKYKNFAAGRTKEENMERAKQLTERLVERIPTIQKIEVGLNILHFPSDFDVVARSEYTNLDNYHATITHPAHDELVSFLHEVIDTNHMVTYETA